MTLAWPSVCDIGHLHQEQLLLLFLGAMLLGGGLADSCAVSMPQAPHYITHLSLFSISGYSFAFPFDYLTNYGVGA